MELAIISLGSILGGFLTFFCVEKFGISALKSSALLSLIVAIAAHFINSETQLDIFATCFFGASFVGMASSKFFNKITILIPSIIFGIIYWKTSAHFNHLGGTLGTSACLSCLLSLGFIQIKNKLFKRSNS